MVLLLAINIFPLFWAIWLSFTNFRANRPNEDIKGVGLQNYERILGDPDIWFAMQATAHFVFWTIVLQTLIGFTLAYLLDRKFRGHAFWTTIILVPMMLSPAFNGATKWTPTFGGTASGCSKLASLKSVADFLLNPASSCPGRGKPRSCSCASA